jgi:hypothetical protein
VRVHEAEALSAAPWVRAQRGACGRCAAFQAGAIDYLLKTMIREDLLEIGRRYIPAEIAASLAVHVAMGPLNDREISVLSVDPGLLRQDHRGRAGRDGADDQGLHEQHPLGVPAIHVLLLHVDPSAERVAPLTACCPLRVGWIGIAGIGKLTIVDG